MTRAHFAIGAVLAMMTASCHRESGRPATPRTRDEAQMVFARCLFDAPPARRDGAGFEAALRRALRADRMSFAVRGGRCESALDGVRDQDPTSGVFVRAWNELLPLAQATHPDDIALEQSIRHAGNAWREW